MLRRKSKVALKGDALVNDISISSLSLQDGRLARAISKIMPLESWLPVESISRLSELRRRVKRDFDLEFGKVADTESLLQKILNWKKLAKESMQHSEREKSDYYYSKWQLIEENLVAVEKMDHKEPDFMYLEETLTS